MGRKERSLITLPVLPGLVMDRYNNLFVVIRSAIWLLSNDPEWQLPQSYTTYDLEADLSTASNWYRAGQGHVIPSVEECVEYAKDYIHEARRKIEGSL